MLGARRNTIVFFYKSFILKATFQQYIRQQKRRGF